MLALMRPLRDAGPTREELRWTKQKDGGEDRGGGEAASETSPERRVALEVGSAPTGGEERRPGALEYERREVRRRLRRLKGAEERQDFFQGLREGPAFLAIPEMVLGSRLRGGERVSSR
jgi:hypothetical protein